MIRNVSSALVRGTQKKADVLSKNPMFTYTNISYVRGGGGQEPHPTLVTVTEEQLGGVKGQPSISDRGCW